MYREWLVSCTLSAWILSVWSTVKSSVPKLDGKLWQFSPGKSYWFPASQESRCSSIHLLDCLGKVLHVTLRRRAKTRSLNSSDSHTARVTGAFSPSKLISPQTQQHRTMQSSQNLLTITLPPFGRRRVGWRITFKEVHHNFLYRSIKGVILYWILFPLGDSISTAISRREGLHVICRSCTRGSMELPQGCLSVLHAYVLR